MTSALRQQPQAVTASLLKSWLDENRVILVDVREAVEYAQEHITQAQLLPLSQFSSHQISVDHEKVIVLYCQSGRRSAQAARKLLAAGFHSVAHLEGGLPSWKAEGYPVAKKANAPISIFRQVQIVAGSIVFLGTVLGAFVAPQFLFLSGFVGAGLMFAGVTNTCALGMLLAKLPYNQRSV